MRSDDQRKTYEQCNDQLAPLADALSDVDARLSVGLTQSDLSDLVGYASVAYKKIDVDQLGTGTCLSAGAKLESALNNYIATVQT